MSEQCEPSMAIQPISSGTSMSSRHSEDHANPGLPIANEIWHSPTWVTLFPRARNRGSTLSETLSRTCSRDVADHWVAFILANRMTMCVWFPGFKCIRFKWLRELSRVQTTSCSATGLSMDMASGWEHEISSLRCQNPMLTSSEFRRWITPSHWIETVMMHVYAFAASVRYEPYGVRFPQSCNPIPLTLGSLAWGAGYNYSYYSYHSCSSTGLLYCQLDLSRFSNLWTILQFVSFGVCVAHNGKTQRRLPTSF